MLPALLLLCLFTACGMQSMSSNSSVIEAPVKGTTSTSTSITSSTAETSTTTTVDKPISEEPTSSDSPKSNYSSATNIAPKEPIKSAECSHNYVKKIVAPTCTKQGYTLHTCKKCGKSYRDSYVAPRHQYGKYLCDICGRPDPDNPIHSLSAWLEKNGTLNGAGRYSSIEYKESGLTYSITGNPYSLDIIYLEFEKGDERFRISFLDTHECSLDYSNNGIEGRAEMKSFAVCSSTPLKLTYFDNRSKTVCSQEEFATLMTGKIDGLLKTIQNKMLYPRTGLTLKNFGFKAY